MISILLCSRALVPDLVLRLFVSMSDQTSQQATGLASIVAASLGLVDIAVHITGGLIIGIVVVVKVGCNNVNRRSRLSVFCSYDSRPSCSTSDAGCP